LKFWNEAFEFECVECGAPPGYVAQPAPFPKADGRLSEAFFLCEEHFAIVQDGARYHVRPIAWPERGPAEREQAPLPHPEPPLSTATPSAKQRTRAMLDAHFRCPHCSEEESFSTSPELARDRVDALLTSFRSDVAAHLQRACYDEDSERATEVP
jgi:hypothetical protein